MVVDLATKLRRTKQWRNRTADDKFIHLYAAAALLSTLIGVAVFLKALTHTTNTLSPHTQREMNLGFAVGVLLQLSAFVIDDTAMTTALLVTSLITIVWASMRYAKAKGYSRLLGAVGLLGVVGLIVLLLLPPRSKQQGSTAAEVSWAGFAVAPHANRECSRTASQNPYEPSILTSEGELVSGLKPAIAYGVIFLLGCALVAVPMYVRASLINADETARQEQTMLPGILIWLGTIFAPIGGTFLCGIRFLLTRRNRR